LSPKKTVILFFPRVIHHVACVCWPAFPILLCFRFLTLLNKMPGTTHFAILPYCDL
jgi:hypothetical protein